MRWVALFLVVTAGCGSSVLTGDAASDLDTLMTMVDVDCNAEPLCGAVPHCMTDALRAGQVGTIESKVYVGYSEYYIEHLFTYDEGVVNIADGRNDSSEHPGISERHCAGISARLLANNCWTVGAEGCELP